MSVPLRLGSVAWATLGLVLPCLALAQERPKIKGMPSEEVALGTPAIGKVLLAFVFVLGLAVAIALLLRRYQPQLSRHFAGGGAIRVLERGTVGAVRVYVLEVAGSKVLLSEQRGATAMVVLEAAPAGERAAERASQS